MEPELIRPEVYGYQNGLEAAKNVVIDLETELRASGHTQWANEIHNLVWRRLRDRTDALVDAERARYREYDTAGKAAAAAFLADLTANAPAVFDQCLACMEGRHAGCNREVASSRCECCSPAAKAATK